MSITLVTTDKALNIVGDPITRWTDLDVTIKHNEPGAGTMTVPLSRSAWEQCTPGNRILVIRNPVPAFGYPGEIFSAGPIEQRQEKWGAGGSDSGPGTLTIGFTDDLVRVVERITYPNPSQAATAQTVARWTMTGTAGAVIRALINLNAGPGALTSRRVPHLVMGDAAVGANVTFGTRFEPAGDAIRSIALLGGGLGVRTRQVEKTIVVDVYQPRDLSGTVRFSRGLRNLREYSLIETAPTVTAAIVGGQDEGADRLIVERTDPAGVASWGRSEVFVDKRQSDDTVGNTTELDQAGDEALARGAGTAQLTAVVVDTDTQRYGVHYRLSDRVSVELNSGVVITDLVRAVNLTATPGAGEVVTPLVGSQEASSDPVWIAYIRDIAGRLARLEAA